MSKLKNNGLSNPMRPYLIRMIFNMPGFGILSFLLSLVLIVMVNAESDIAIARCQSIGAWAVLLLYITSTYGLGWSYGFRDINVVKMGYLPNDPYKGMKLGAWALIPSAVLTVAVWVLHFAGPDIPATIYYEIYHYYFKMFYLLTNSHWLLYAVPLLITPLVAQWGFHNGKNNISLMRRIVYKNTEKRPKKTDKRLR